MIPPVSKGGIPGHGLPGQPGGLPGQGLPGQPNIGLPGQPAPLPNFAQGPILGPGKLSVLLSVMIFLLVFTEKLLRKILQLPSWHNVDKHFNS